jgi:hypothetical protein
MSKIGQVGSVRLQCMDYLQQEQVMSPILEYVYFKKKRSLKPFHDELKHQRPSENVTIEHTEKTVSTI